MFEGMVSWVVEVSIDCLELAGMADNAGKYDSTVMMWLTATRMQWRQVVIHLQVHLTKSS